MGAMLSRPQRSFNPPVSPEVRLRFGADDKRCDAAAGGFERSAQRAGEILDAGGSWRLTGPAGSGVSTVLVECVAESLRRGVRADEVCFLTPSKEAAARAQAAVGARIASGVGADVQVAVGVQSVHSFAFSIVRAAAVRAAHADGSDGGMLPRLITGAEQDAVIRELLLGHHEQGGAYWPEEQRPALELVGFARALRDFLLRAVERGVGPEELKALGQRWGIELWSAAGLFLEEYERTMELSGARRLNASELVTAALQALNADPGLLDQLRAQSRLFVLDDAQNVDPQTARLCALFVDSADCAVIAGDPEQAVFGFRGASEDFLLHHPVDHECRLDASLRVMTSREIVVADSVAAQSSAVADVVRREHLLGGRPWEDIAVIVRGAGEVEPMRRVLLGAGVPVSLDPTAVVLSEEHIVQAVLLAVRAARAGAVVPLGGQGAVVLEPLSRSEVVQLASGPVGGADPVVLRRVLRGVRKAELMRARAAGQGIGRRAVDCLADLLNCGQDAVLGLDALRDVLSERELAVLQRIVDVVSAGREAVQRGESVEMVLWEVWRTTGLSDHLAAVSLRGGAAGSQADRDLDAMLALFDAAGDWVERRPSASIDSFVHHIMEQQLPTGMRDRRGQVPQAVSVLTAHACAGREWGAVVVAGVQEGSWPAAAEAGTLFLQERLVDLLDEGIEPDTFISRAAERLVSERRLLGVALSRAVDRVWLTCVDAPDAAEAAEPSRFVDDVASAWGVTPVRVSMRDGDAQAQAVGGLRVLSVPGFVAELRRAVCDQSTPMGLRRQAARQLARLATAGVYGAHPGQWWGVHGPSSQSQLEAPGRPVMVNPSRFEQALGCPLRSVVSRWDPDDEPGFYQQRGIILHAFSEAVAAFEAVRAEQEAAPDASAQPVDVAAGLAEAREMVVEAIDAITPTVSAQANRVRAQWRAAVDRTQQWTVSRSANLDLVATELPVRHVVGRVAERDVIIKGRADRIDATREQPRRLVIADLKTSNTAANKVDAAQNPQLMAYQMAVREQLGEDIAEAQLVYPVVENKQAAVREQPPLDESMRRGLRLVFDDVAESLLGPDVEAFAIDQSLCDTCAAKVMCPVNPEGKAVTDVH